MKIKLQHFFAAAVLFAFAGIANATTGFTFLEIPVGAREGAMGGAGAALVTGPSSAAHNPAATAWIERGGLALMTNRQFGDTRAQFIGLSLKKKKLVLTPHYWGTRVSDIEYRESPTRDPISTFDATNSALGVSGGLAVSKDFAVGATIRYLHSKILYESSDGFSTDAGVFWKTPVSGLNLAAAVNHLGRVSEYIHEDVTLPTTARMAGSLERGLKKAGSLLLTVEGQAVQDNTPVYRTGIEFRAPKILALRAGWVAGLEAEGMSLGLGLYHNILHFDYAFIPYREELGEGHRFAIGVDL